jgi:mono/diheme cytochrome c family protein
MVGRKTMTGALLLGAVAWLPLRAGQGPTFSGQIAAIIHTHCADCHRPGGAAPFALLAHRDVASRADDILRVIKSGEMPPWKAVGKQGEFLGDRRLTESQKRLIEAWIADGAPAGTPQELRNPRRATTAWQLGEPDVLLQPASLGPRTPANLLAADLASRGDLWVTGIEVRPLQAGLHNVLLWLDLPVTSPVLEVDNAGQQIRRQLFPAWLRDRLLAPAPSALRPAQRAAAIAARDRRLVGIWAADCLAQSFPADSAMRFPAGSRLIVETAETHTTPALEIGLHVTAAPPQRPAAVVAVEAITPRLATTRGAPRQGAFQSPVDCELQIIAPHADESCREVRVNLTLPDGHSESLLWIEHWEPQWETSYQYRRPLQIPARSRIDVQFVMARDGDDSPSPGTPALVAAQLIPLHAGDYGELVRAMQRTQMNVAREPVKAAWSRR